jgi:hypothetical protein
MRRWAFLSKTLFSYCVRRFGDLAIYQGQDCRNDLLLTIFLKVSFSNDMQIASKKGFTIYTIIAIIMKTTIDMRYLSTMQT